MSTTLRNLLPTGYQWRELWDMQNIWSPDAGTTYYVPTSCKGGHRLTCTNGAYKARTTNGLIMRGAEKVTITDAAAISINDNLTIVLPTFVLNDTFDSDSAADMGIMSLNNGSVIARLNSTTGALDFIFDDADGGADETVSTTKVSWAANTEWQVAVTFDKDAGASSAETFVNGVTDNTSAECDTVLTIPAGDTVYGYDNTTYFTGKFTRGPMIWDTALVSEANLLLVYKGSPFATNLVLHHQLYEGRGLTIDDKATGAALDGTISGTNIANIWDYSVSQVCAGLDGINDYIVSAATVNLTAPWTALWVGRMKSTYIGTTERELMQGYVDANNRFEFSHNSSLLYFGTRGQATSKSITGTPGAYDSYAILLGSLDADGNSAAYQNGTALGTETATPIMVGAGLSTIYLGAYAGPALYDVSQCMVAGIIDGELSAAEALKLSRDLNLVKGLALTI